MQGPAPEVVKHDGDEIADENEEAPQGPNDRPH